MEVLITKESDVYGMGMVVFEASSNCPVPYDASVKSHVNFLGLDGRDAVLRVQ